MITKKPKVEFSQNAKGRKQYVLLGKRALNQTKLLRLLSDYLPIKTIAKLTNKSLAQVYKSFSVYRKNGLINKDRSLTTEGIKRLNLATRYTPKGRIFSNKIRLHNLVFKLPILNKGWKLNREKILNIANIKSHKINMGELAYRPDYYKQIQGLAYPKNVVFYMGDYSSDTPIDAFSRALEDLKSLATKVQRLLRVKLFNTKYLDFEISRQHFALIKNQLAEQYNKEVNKLFVYDDLNTLRLIIDDSLNLDEFEAVSKEHALSDSEKVQKFFKEDILEKGLSLSVMDNNTKELAKRVLKISEGMNDLSVALEQTAGNVTKIIKKLGR